ncbi:MAG TPA: O-antigen ligase family protein [Sphingomonas sp.]|jgi:hypothetical protein|uniref:O-antigen ligase family protein n=1 Tax=Sphingomonas sp. TaxID=28214 RepID=UPI002EDA2A5A
MQNPDARPGPLHWCALALFAVTAILSIAAVRLSIGPLPIRIATLLASGACLALADAGRFRDAVGRSWRLIAVVAAVATLGVVVSILASAPPADLAQQVIEIHVQAIMSAVIAYALVLHFGVGPVLGCFLGAYALSAVVALGQVLGVDPAWEARAAIGRLMRDPVLTQHWYVSRERALGLSFSPVHFGTQTCLALAASTFLRFARAGVDARRLDWTLVGITCLLVALAAVTGNRSPLLGMLLFLIIYGLITAPRLVLIALPLLLLAAIALPLLLDDLSQAGVRVAETEDGSSAGRATLRAFGWFLIGQRPIGYGLTFDSVEHWASFAHRSIYMDNPLTYRQWAIHNYYLNVMAKYGVLIVGIAAFILPRNRVQAWLWLGFVPYLVHIFYHNDGPMQGDFLIFFILPAALFLASRSPGVGGERSARAASGRSWRRAFAEPVA